MATPRCVLKWTLPSFLGSEVTYATLLPDPLLSLRALRHYPPSFPLV